MKTYKMALSGVLLAINMIVLFGATMLPGIELTLFAVSSFITAIVVMQASPKRALLFYVASSLLGMLILPNKVAMVPYIIFFGYYGILKYYIESTKILNLQGRSRQIAEQVIKAVIFVLSFGSGIVFFKDTFMTGVTLPEYPAAILVAASIVAFLGYDYVFTLIIGQLRKYLKLS